MIRNCSEKKIFIDDTGALGPGDVRARARRIVREHGDLGAIVIDYLQLMSGSNDRGANREQEISNISRSLKGLAKELNIPVIALSQLNRSVETRGGDKKPQLSDLRESGSIEQDADMVMFLYRPEYYEITANEFGESNKGETHVRIAKHRNGSLETIKLRALLHIQKFIEEDNTNLPGLPPTAGNWKPLDTISGSGGPRLFIQRGSKMNTEAFDNADNEPPF